MNLQAGLNSCSHSYVLVAPTKYITSKQASCSSGVAEWPRSFDGKVARAGCRAGERRRRGESGNVSEASDQKEVWDVSIESRGTCGVAVYDTSASVQITLGRGIKYASTDAVVT